MNENHEIPKKVEVSTYETNFFRVVGSKDWHPKLSVGPFLPITSNGDGNLPYKLTEKQGSTLIDYSQNLMLI